MGQSVLVFISHSSDDKESFIEPVVRDLEDCYINVWIDKRRIVPGENLRKSIFREGLDKADVALIFFTQNSLKSSWVDREIKHVLREGGKKANDFDLKKIISIFDSQETYKAITERYPELTDDLLHLMPENYNKVHLGQLVSAIWSKYLSLQGGDIETQRQLLGKERDIFQRDKEIQDLKSKLDNLKSTGKATSQEDEFRSFVKSKKIEGFIRDRQRVLSSAWVEANTVPNASEALAFGLIDLNPKNPECILITARGKDFFKWFLINDGNQGG